MFPTNPIETDRRDYAQQQQLEAFQIKFPTNPIENDRWDLAYKKGCATWLRFPTNPIENNR